ncbi:DUF1145 domain-containing protein [Bifidobacterium breve]
MLVVLIGFWGMLICATVMPFVKPFFCIISGIRGV